MSVIHLVKIAYHNEIQFVDGLMQNKHNYSALTMVLHLFSIIIRPKSILILVNPKFFAVFAAFRLWVELIIHVNDNPTETLHQMVTYI